MSIDEKNYTVTCVNGFRRGCLRRKEAFALAQRMNEQMRNAGWAGKARIFYRDGSEVLTKDGGGR